MSTKNRLIKKSIISQNNYNDLFNYLNMHPVYDPEFRVLLKQKLKGYYSCGHPKLTTVGIVHKKCWFINSGMVIGMTRVNNRNIISMIFKEGEFAILPDSFFYNHLPNCYFIACPDTHLLEMSSEDVKEVFERFPKARELFNMIIIFNAKNVLERAKLPRLPAKEGVIELHRLYRDIVGPNRKVKLMDVYQANFLGITKGTFSKILRQIYG